MVKLTNDIKNKYDNLGQDIGFGNLMSDDDKALNQILEIIYIVITTKKE